MNLDNLIKEYQNLGYEYADASSKVCQDIILSKIARSQFLVTTQPLNKKIC